MESRAPSALLATRHPRESMPQGVWQAQCQATRQHSLNQSQGHVQRKGDVTEGRTQEWGTGLLEGRARGTKAQERESRVKFG